jgi:hypothetical protein
MLVLFHILDKKNVFFSFLLSIAIYRLKVTTCLTLAGVAIDVINRF